MNLRETQSRFALAVAFLILEAEKKGYDVTLGDAYRDPRAFGEVGEEKGYSHKNSLHKVRLAIDLNLFRFGKYITDSEGHKELHRFWVDNFGGSEMIEGDWNHYSFPHEGMR